MQVTTKELRIQPGRILKQVENGEEFTVTYRGKAIAKITPIDDENTQSENTLFGLCKNHNDEYEVEDLVRKMRDGRTF